MIDDATLHCWKHNQLGNAEALLTAAIHESRNPTYHALACRALVRAHLRQWDAAIADATEVFLAPLSHALSLIYQVHQNSAIRHWLHCKECSSGRQWEKKQGIPGVRHRVRALPFNSRYISSVDQGVCPIHSSLVILRSLYIAQAIIAFMAGEHDDAISRVDDLIDTVPFDSIFYVAQARAYRATTQRISPLTFLTGIYASSPWKLTYGEP